MTTLDRLLKEERILTHQYNDISNRLDAVKQAVLVERFKDRPQFKKGDIILVPRKLFGKKVWWPAKIWEVVLRYSDGHYNETYRDDPGGYWENYHISYRVKLQVKDGEFIGAHDSFNHDQVQAAPADADD